MGVEYGLQSKLFFLSVVSRQSTVISLQICVIIRQKALLLFNEGLLLKL